MKIRRTEEFFSRVSNLASQGLWFPNSSEKISGVAVEPEVTEIQTYINARKGFDRGLTDEDHLNSLPGSSLKNSISDRARGSLIGTAVGDALGTTIEFSTPGTFQPVSEITGGGPFKLKAGEWTDDSSMMQCLAHSLTRTGEFDLKDQIDLYTKWWKEGAFSVTANCFDIGMTVQSALQEYQQTGNPEAGPDDPYSAGNEGGAYEGEWIPGGYTKAGTAEATMSGGEHIVHNNNIDNLSKIDNIYVEKLQ